MECESLVPFHTLWDCEGSQYSAKDFLFTIEENTSLTTWLESDIFTLGFGGFYLCKILVNPACNCFLAFNGQNYGIQTLRTYKFHPSLSGVKNAVFIQRSPRRFVGLVDC